MKYANNKKLGRPASGKDAGRLFCFGNSPKKEIVHNRQQAGCSQSGQVGDWDKVLPENETFGSVPGSRTVEIIEGSFEWDVKPRSEADDAARFEALDTGRRIHYSAMAAAGLAADEAPFPQEREWRALRGRIKSIAGTVRGVVCGVLAVLAIPAIGVAFGLLAAWAMIAEEGF